MGDPTGVTATKAAAAATIAATTTTTAGVAARPSTPVPEPVAVSGDVVMGDDVPDWFRDVRASVEGVEEVVAAADDEEQGASLEDLEGALVSTSAICLF